MGLYDQFPYTNFHELNLDWLIGEMKKLKEDFNNLPDEIIEKLLANFKITNFVNVKLLGAKGDGVTNDTAAIQNALDKYKAIFIPAGTYKIDSLYISNDCTIIGENSDSTLINGLIKTASYEDLVNSNIPGGVHDAILCNLSITHGGLRMYGYRNLLSHVYIHNCEQGFVSEWATYLGGVAETDEGNVGFMETIVDKCRFYNNEKGVIWKGPHDSIFHDCWFYLNGVALSLEKSEKYTATASIINNSHFYANSETACVDNAGCYLFNTQIESTGFNNPSGVDVCALNLANGGSRVVNCFIFSNTVGVALKMLSSDNYVNDCFLFNNATALECRGQKNDFSVLLRNNTKTHDVLALDKTCNVNIKGQLSQFSQPAIRIISKTIPTAADAEHAVVNDSGSTVIVYQRGQGATFVKHGDQLLTAQAANCIVLENGDSIYYNDAVPEDWTWMPVNL